MKAYLKKTAWLMAPLALVVMAVNFFGDAANIYSDVEERMATAMVAGLHVANAYNYDERILQRKLIERDPTPPELLVLGSSRVMLFDGKLFSASAFRNHGVGGATLEDIAGIYQLHKNNTSLPKRIVLGLDPWILNDHNSLDKWMEFLPEFSQFMDQDPPWSPLRPQRKALGQLISPSYFQQSLPMLYDRLFHPELTEIQPVSEVQGESFIRMSDGSVRYQAEITQASPEQVDERARTALGGFFKMDRYTELSAAKKQILERLLDDWAAQGIQVQLVLIPFHPIVYADLVSKDRYAVLPQFQHYVIELAAQKGVRLTGSLDPGDLGMGRTHFYDSMHMNPAGVARVLEGADRFGNSEFIYFQF